MRRRGCVRSQHEPSNPAAVSSSRSGTDHPNVSRLIFLPPKRPRGGEKEQTPFVRRATMPRGRRSRCHNQQANEAAAVAVAVDANPKRKRKRCPLSETDIYAIRPVAVAQHQQQPLPPPPPPMQLEPTPNRTMSTTKRPRRRQVALKLAIVATSAAWVLLLLSSPPLVDARTWKEVDLLPGHGPYNVLNAYRNVYLIEEDVRYRNTIPPTPSPTVSAMPSPSPTISRPPSQQPSTMPSVAPSSAPSPPLDPYPPNDPPASPEAYYFNYNTTRGARFGPGIPELTPSFDSNDIVMTYKNNYWSTVDLPPYPHNTWIEFTDSGGWGPWKGVLDNHDPLRNQCGSTGLQSPIDLVETGASCDETHEVRSRPGDFRIGGNSVLKLIEHNKLRLKYQRRNCPDRTQTECMEPDPPVADFPNGWSGETDTLHVDFKIPSEHTIEGKRYDAEMQIFNLHVGRRRTPVQAAVIRATETGFNYYFEEALKVFEKQYQYDLQQCNLKKQQQSNRKLSESHGEEDGAARATPQGENNDQELTHAESDRRDLQIGVWDPFHSMLIPSIHFWRYDGSLTEPPCGEFVSWFVCDVPMEISLQQLERMKAVLFTHVDPDCNPTSTQFDHSVARPLQDRAGRPVWRCKPSDFVADPPGMYT